MEVVDALDPLVDLRRVLLRVLDRPFTTDENAADFTAYVVENPFTTVPYSSMQPFFEVRFEI